MLKILIIVYFIFVPIRASLGNLTYPNGNLSPAENNERIVHCGYKRIPINQSINQSSQNELSVLINGELFHVNSSFISNRHILADKVLILKKYNATECRNNGKDVLSMIESTVQEIVKATLIGECREEEPFGFLVLEIISSIHRHYPCIYDEHPENSLEYVHTLHLTRNHLNEICVVSGVCPRKSVHKRKRQYNKLTDFGVFYITGFPTNLESTTDSVTVAPTYVPAPVFTRDPISNEPTIDPENAETTTECSPIPPTYVPAPIYITEDRPIPPTYAPAPVFTESPNPVEPTYYTETVETTTECSPIPPTYVPAPIYVTEGGPIPPTYVPAPVFTTDAISNEPTIDPENAETATECSPIPPTYVPAPIYITEDGPIPPTYVPAPVFTTDAHQSPTPALNDMDTTTECSPVPPTYVPAPDYVTSSSDGPIAPTYVPAPVFTNNPNPISTSLPDADKISTLSKYITDEGPVEGSTDLTTIEDLTTDMSSTEEFLFSTPDVNGPEVLEKTTLDSLEETTTNVPDDSENASMPNTENKFTERGLSSKSPEEATTTESEASDDSQLSTATSLEISESNTDSDSDSTIETFPTTEESLPSSIPSDGLFSLFVPDGSEIMETTTDFILSSSTTDEDTSTTESEKSDYTMDFDEFSTTESLLSSFPPDESSTLSIHGGSETMEITADLTSLTTQKEFTTANSMEASLSTADENVIILEGSITTEASEGTRDVDTTTVNVDEHTSLSDLTSSDMETSRIESTYLPTISEAITKSEDVPTTTETSEFIFESFPTSDDSVTVSEKSETIGLPIEPVLIVTTENIESSTLADLEPSTAEMVEYTTSKGITVSLSDQDTTAESSPDETTSYELSEERTTIGDHPQGPQTDPASVSTENIEETIAIEETTPFPEPITISDSDTTSSEPETSLAIEVLTEFALDNTTPSKEATPEMPEIPTVSPESQTEDPCDEDHICFEPEALVSFESTKI